MRKWDAAFITDLRDSDSRLIMAGKGSLSKEKAKQEQIFSNSDINLGVLGARRVT